MKNLPFQLASKIEKIPFLSRISPSVTSELDEVEQGQYLKAQNLAIKAIDYIADQIVAGWSEKQTAKLIETYLRDNGVDSFFHKPFVWFGENTRFNHMGRNKDYLPSDRLLKQNEPFVLDVAPIVDGYCVDVGLGYCLEKNTEFDAAQKYLQVLRSEIPQLFMEQINSESPDGKQIWSMIDSKIIEAGYDNIHRKYPFSVLGHRLHHVPKGPNLPGLLNFGWQSYWSFISRGLFGQLLNHNYSGNLEGLWAIEPHIGKNIGANSFGTKFEEILVVTKADCYWLADREEISQLV